MTVTYGSGNAAGPGQLADKDKPTQLAAVDKTGAVKVQGGSTDLSGIVRQGRIDAEGRMVISDTDVLRELLVEMRLLTAMYAEKNFIHDVELRRADIDRDL